ncbi:TCP-1/cpn60 chaperonin family protein [Methylobacterium isbiliense]|uniref:TCP-1/cpn60 chaperonin family protein n=1 Tax=Methylobacterium isbiliense TaxID=315478 RepID=UPI00338F2BCF
MSETGCEPPALLRPRPTCPPPGVTPSPALSRLKPACPCFARQCKQRHVPGGGTALLRAQAAVAALKSDNADVQAGIKIVLKALEAPIRQIAENAGVEGSIVVGQVSNNTGSETYGFNAQTEEYVDLLQAGVVDPAKVVRTALQGAASVAGLLVTTEAMVADAPKKESPAPAMPGGGMGGMGGMDF